MVRKDWLDKLGLEEPSTMDEVADMLRAFINDDPDGDGEADTIGLAMRSDVYGEYPNNTFGIDNIFTAILGAYPSIWNYCRGWNSCIWFSSGRDEGCAYTVKQLVYRRID